MFVKTERCLLHFIPPCFYKQRWTYQMPQRDTRYVSSEHDYTCFAVLTYTFILAVTTGHILPYFSLTCYCRWSGIFVWGTFHRTNFRPFIRTVDAGENSNACLAVFIKANLHIFRKRIHFNTLSSGIISANWRMSAKDRAGNICNCVLLLADGFYFNNPFSASLAVSNSKEDSTSCMLAVIL